MSVDKELLKQQLDLRRESFIHFMTIHRSQKESSFSCAEERHLDHPPVVPVSGQAKSPPQSQALRGVNDCQQACEHTVQHSDTRSHGDISPEVPDRT